MLHMALVLSTEPHAKVTSIDWSAALQLPGVVGHVSIADIPTNGSNSPADDGRLFVVDNKTIFAADSVRRGNQWCHLLTDCWTCLQTVHSVGETIAAIVAEDVVTARRAAQLVKVHYERLPAVTTIQVLWKTWLHQRRLHPWPLQEAIKRNSYLTPEPITTTKGDYDVNIGKCEVTVAGAVHMGGQEHLYMETQTALVVPGEGNEWYHCTVTIAKVNADICIDAGQCIRLLSNQPGYKHIARESSPSTNTTSQCIANALAAHSAAKHRSRAEAHFPPSSQPTSEQVNHDD